MENEMDNLLKKPIWQMSGEEFLYLTGVNKTGSADSQGKQQYAYGMRALGDALACSLSTIYQLKKDGVLNDAIVSCVGRRIVFDVEKARSLSDQHMAEQRNLRQTSIVKHQKSWKQCLKNKIINIVK